MVRTEYSRPRRAGWRPPIGTVVPPWSEHGDTRRAGRSCIGSRVLNRPLTFLPLPGAAPHEKPAPAPSPAHASGIGVEVLTTAEAFADLAPAWNRLHAETVLASVFNSWIWQFQWWQVYGRRQPLRLLVAWAGEQIVGILPLYIHSVTTLGIRVRLLRLVGTGGDTHPDDLGPVLEPSHAHGTAHALARAALALRDGDVLLLTDLSPECPLRAAVESGAHLAGRALHACVAERIAFTRLPSSWDEYLRSLSSHHRLGVRYKRRKLAKEHGARFFVWDDPARFEAGFARLAELHRRRWASSGGSESFASPEYLEFHLRVMKACLPRGWLRLYCLEVDGEIAAMTYCYRFRNAIYCMQSGFDPAKGRQKVGSVLLGHAFEHAIGEGNRVFDFLRGEHGYKDHVANDYRETHSVRVFRATPGGFAYRLRRLWLPRLKARLLRRPPPRIRP
jgi:CelD/BcsL family acetyltransferase involved in cellulose biosynthesis